MAFTIKELESLSGIKAHTIRIWEQRYNFLKPERTATNIRTYSNDDLKTLLTVALLNKYGYKISLIDSMQTEQRSTAILNLKEARNERLVNQLIACMVDLRNIEFEDLLDQHVKKHGLAESMNIIFQFLEKIGLLWQSNKLIPAQEHIVSNIIRQKIISAIDQIKIPSRYQPNFILFLPEYEHHEIGLLIVYYLLKKNSIPVIYLGANVPLKDVQYITAVKKPQYLYTHLTSFPRQLNLTKFIHQLTDRLYETKLCVSGAIVSSYTKSLPSNVGLLRSFAEVQGYISKL